MLRSGGSWSASSGTVRVLDWDPELARSMRPERRAEARVHALASSIDVACGAWEPPTWGATYGLLLLGGRISRTVFVSEVASEQLLGPGDLLMPTEPPEALCGTAVRWIVREPSSLALLDEAFLYTVRRWPELTAALFQRVGLQANRHAIHDALGQLPRVEDRIHALMWFYAERWGRTTSIGMVLPIRLTHEMLGRLVGSKRPTVSLALKRLELDRRVQRQRDGSWLLAQLPASWRSAHDAAPSAS